MELESKVGALRAALAQLDDKFVDVLVLSAGYEFSYEDIARSLSVPVGTVRSRLSRGRTQLRELLMETGQDVSDELAESQNPIPEEHQK
jgi:RNA polymerase sigma-70 factor (ECF subfamily)